MTPIMAAAQAGLCIERGPVFRVDLFNLAGQDQIVIFMVAHHLCVDMVSWRIIVQDLSQILETGSLAVETPPSFRSWCALQSSHNKTVDTETLLPFEEAPSDLDYWGAHGPLTYGRTDTETFSLSEDMTRLALVDCHKAFSSEPIDVFLAAVAHAFSRIFTDRDVPTLHTESHGREAPAGSHIDLSRTVGWFTTICPLVVSVRADDAVDSVRRIKDMRRSIPGKGRPYFAHKCLGRAAEAASSAMEVLFNYLGGGVQQIEHADSLIRPVELDDDQVLDFSRATADAGPETTRLALFEISAIVVNNRLQFSFLYDGSLSRAGDVRRWIGDCKSTLEETVQGLMRRPAEPTLSDYPLLPLTYDDLRTLTKVALPRVGIDHASSSSHVEDIYPCTPVQEGMLISQLRDPSAYIFHAVYSVKHASARHLGLDADRLGRAWQKVVDRHAALRTVFIESVHRGGVFDQVVLKKVDCGVVLLRSSDEEAMARLGQVTLRGTANQAKQPQLPHRLAVCTTHSGRVLMKLEVNHAAMDGGSLSIILEELAFGYAGTLDSAPGPLYRDYVQYTCSRPARADTEYWMRYLDGLKPCYFPKLNTSTSTSTSTAAATDTRRLRSAALQFDRYSELRRLSERMHVTLANMMHAAWAFVLRKHTGSDDVCFGYLTADRDAPVENIRGVVGTLINMLCCRVQISSSQTLEDVFRTAQDQHLQSMPFQRCSLARVQHELGLAGKSLYNTSISTQSHSVGGGESGGGSNTIAFEMEEGHDPSEVSWAIVEEWGGGMGGRNVSTTFANQKDDWQYAITVNIEASKASEGVLFRYWSDHVSDDQVQEMARCMAQVLDGFINRPAQSVAELDFELDRKPTTKSPSECRAEAAGAAEAAKDRVIEEPLAGPGTPRSIGKSSSVASSSENSVDTLVKKPSPTAQVNTRAAQSSREKTLLALWSALLNLPDDSISGQDSFFHLGGDSITAMKLVGDARDQGLALTVADVFRHPSFNDMAARVSTPDMDASNEPANGNKPTITKLAAQHDPYERFSLLAASNVDAFLQTSIVPQVCVFRGGLSDVLPATDFQSLAVAGALLESRWMLNYFYLDGDGPLNLGHLKRTCFRLVQALDILRTVFVPSGGRFLQVVLRTLRPAFHVVEVDNESLDDFSTGLLKRDRGGGGGGGAGEGGASPRLGEPFVEFTVVRHRHSSRHRILLRISHAQYDGVCFPKMLDALQAAYRGETVPRPPSFANYLRASAVALTSDHYQHWNKLLEGSSMTEIVRRKGPNYRTTVAGATTATLKRTVHLPPVESGHITTATIVKAAWAYVLVQVSASADVVFGHTISGRNAAVEGVGNMIGPCLNLLPVRVRFGGPGWTARHLLHQVQDQQLANMPHEVLGFREIIRHCTTWPGWTYFTSTVQHQNVDQSTVVRLGDVDYQVGCASTAHEDFADLSVFSQQHRQACDGTDGGTGDMYEIMLSFAEGGAIPHDFAKRALDMLCDAARIFAADPDVALPSQAELFRRPRQVPFDEVSAAAPSSYDDESAFQASSRLQHLGRAQLLDLSTLVSTAWRQVLALPGQQTKTKAKETEASAAAAGNNTSSPGGLDPDTSFFALGGDIIGLAQVAWLLDQGGFPVRHLEDLVDHPTVRGHMAVLASSTCGGGAGARGVASAAAAVVSAAASPLEIEDAAVPVVRRITRVDSSLAKAVRLAKRFTKQKHEPRCEVNAPAAA